MKSTLPYSKYLMIALLQLVIFTGNAQNLLSNPGFSSLGANWNYNGNLVEVNTASVYGGRGSNPCAEIDIEVGLSQRVVVVPGNYYQFTIKGSRRTDFFANTPASVSMRINILVLQPALTTSIKQKRIPTPLLLTRMMFHRFTFPELLQRPLL